MKILNKISEFLKKVFKEDPVSDEQLKLRGKVHEKYALLMGIEQKCCSCDRIMYNAYFEKLPDNKFGKGYCNICVDKMV